MEKMRPKTIDVLLSTLLLFILLGAAHLARADGPAYTLDWWTVDGGGGQLSSAGGEYVLNGTTGQPDAGVLSDGDYTLGGGFWGGAEVAVTYNIHLPLVLRNN
jgi:hypothetical protein